MALNIKDPATDALARELAAVTGESITEAIRVAMSERLARLRRRSAATERRPSLQRFIDRGRARQTLDPRSADEILSYDDAGLPSIVDTSALLAVVLGEDDAEALLDSMARAERLGISAPTLVESVIVAEAKQGREAVEDLWALLTEIEAEIIAFDEAQAETAAAAWRRFGKGRHPASLNLGDLFSYALTSTLGEGLLFKGDDFAATDIAKA